MTDSEIFEEVMHAAYELNIQEEVRDRMNQLRDLEPSKSRTDALLEAYYIEKKKVNT